MPKKPRGSAKKRAGGAAVRILLADDHPLVREGIKSCLEQHPGFRVVGEASNGEEAVAKAKTLSPHVILMDISMPKLTGLEAAKILRRTAPKAKVLILTMHVDRAYVLEIVRSGAKGYLLKDTSPQELIRAVESVQRGEAFFSPGISHVILNEYVKKAKHLTPPSPSEISQREREVLALIAEGKSNKEIANQLYISVRTVETHRENIMRKLDIHTVAGLTRYAIERQIVNVP